MVEWEILTEALGATGPFRREHWSTFTQDCGVECGLKYVLFLIGTIFFDTLMHSFVNVLSKFLFPISEDDMGVLQLVDFSEVPHVQSGNSQSRLVGESVTEMRSCHVSSMLSRAVSFRCAT